MPEIKDDRRNANGPMVLEGLPKATATVSEVDLDTPMTVRAGISKLLASMGIKEGPDDPELAQLTTPKAVILNAFDSIGMGDGPRAVVDPLTNITQMPQGNVTDIIIDLAKTEPHEAAHALAAHLAKLSTEPSLSDMVVTGSLHAAIEVCQAFEDRGLEINEGLRSSMADSIRTINTTLPQGIVGLRFADELIGNLDLDPDELALDHLTAA